MEGRSSKFLSLSSALFSRKKWEANTRRRLFIRELSGGERVARWNKRPSAFLDKQWALSAPHSFHHLSPRLSIHPSILPTIDRRRNSSQSRLNDGRASRNWRNIVVQITEAAKRLQLQIALAGEASPRPRPRSSRPAGNQYSNSFLLTNEFTYKPRLARESINSSPHRERAAPRDFWPSKIFALPFLGFEIFESIEFRVRAQWEIEIGEREMFRFVFEISDLDGGILRRLKFLLGRRFSFKF